MVLELQERVLVSSLSAKPPIKKGPAVNVMAVLEAQVTVIREHAWWAEKTRVNV